MTSWFHSGFFDRRTFEFAGTALDPQDNFTYASIPAPPKFGQSILGKSFPMYTFALIAQISISPSSAGVSVSFSIKEAKNDFFASLFFALSFFSSSSSESEFESESESESSGSIFAIVASSSPLRKTCTQIFTCP